VGHEKFLPKIFSFSIFNSGLSGLGSSKMPLYDYLCLDCAAISELLVTGSNEKPVCSACGGSNLKKMLSAHSSFSGAHALNLPGPSDTSCCGSAPGQAGCAGPGSCCGKATHH